MGTQELQVIEFEVTELVPAKVSSNINDLKNFMKIVKQKYEGWIVTEDDIDIAKSERTKLNKLEKKISDERKKIQKKANADIEILIDTLKTYEKEVKGISNFIGEQLKGYNEKIREKKKVEVQKKINNIFTRNPGLKIFLEWNDKWLDKSFTFKKIENEVQEQYDELEKKQDFINSQIAKANSEIEFMITFESMKFLMTEDYNVITEKIESKKNEIKQTEANLRQKAEEEKQRAIEEAEIQKQKEIEEIKKQQIVQIELQNMETTKKEKYYDTTIRFMNAPLSFLIMLKKEADRLGIETEKISSKQISEDIKMGRLGNEDNRRQNQLMTFTVGNEEVKLSPAIVKNYLVNGNGNITDQEINYFMHLCRARKLNPFVKEVYLIKYGTQPAAMVVSRDALEKRAIKHKDYNGKKTGLWILKKDTGELEKRDGTIYVKSKEEIIGAWCTVYRKNWENPVIVEVNFDEYVQRKSDGKPNTNWENKPVTMITKVAKAQALREAFIEDLDGMYEAEEIGVNESELDNTPVQVTEPYSNDNIEDAVEVISENEDDGNPF